jgi:hypothetical protein
MEIVNLPKDHISYSQINMYKRCPKQYYFRYFEDRIIPPKWIMVAGKAGHNTMEFNNKYKMESGHDEKISTVIDYLANSWDEEKDKHETITYSKIKPGEVVSKISKPVIKYFTDGAFERDIPTGVEKEFRLNFEGIDTEVMGYIDVEYEDGVYDYKFSQRKPSIQQIATSDQLKMYAVSYLIEKRILPKRLGYTYFIPTKDPQANVYNIPMIEKFIENFMSDLKEAIISISNSTRSGVFPRNSASFMCSPEGCGYWDICKPGQKKIFYDLKTTYERK